MTTGPEWIEVATEAAGQSLGDWLEHSHGLEAGVLLARGGVWVNRQRVQDPTFVLHPGAQVVIHRPPLGEQPELLVDESWVIYEDADLIVLNKPAGTYVEMTPWDVNRHVRGALLRWLAKRDGTPPTLHLAHRLDRDTSGVLLLTKNPAMNAAMYASFGAGEVQKTYLAACLGNPDFEEHIITTGHGRSRNGLFRVYPFEQVGEALADGSKIKHMQTNVRVVQRFTDAALIEATPHTGRTHQIRLHLAYLGHPLLGDSKYGGPTTWRGITLTAHRLHAWRLVLPHPHTRSLLELSAPLPAWALATNDH